MIIAQRFNVGRGRFEDAKVPKGWLTDYDVFSRPFETQTKPAPTPTFQRWAIINYPSGMDGSLAKGGTPHGKIWVRISRLLPLSSAHSGASQSGSKPTRLQTFREFNTGASL